MRALSKCCLNADRLRESISHLTGSPVPIPNDSWQTDFSWYLIWRSPDAALCHSHAFCHLIKRRGREEREVWGVMENLLLFSKSFLLSETIKRKKRDSQSSPTMSELHHFKINTWYILRHEYYTCVSGRKHDNQHTSFCFVLLCLFCSIFH